MAGETNNIAKIAEILSNDLFSEFFWQRTGPINQNWPCELQQKHSAVTHPSDVVFWYDEPYSLVRTYVNCDLKSYAKTSISTSAVNSATQNLARAQACTEISTNWRDLYVHKGVTAEFCSLLFVYNHDGVYDNDFSTMLRGVAYEKLQLPAQSKLVVLGPHEIFWLNNVRYEIVQMRGKGILPMAPRCKYFYPHLAKKKNIQLGTARAATLEMLTGPWIILSYEHDDFRKGMVVFYRRNGDSVEEFLYLIDYLLHYQVLNGDVSVIVKMIEPSAIASVLFAKAIEQYIEGMDAGEQIKAVLRSIEWESTKEIHSQFSPTEIGMNDGH